MQVGATGAPTADRFVRERLAPPQKEDTGLRGRLIVAVLALASFGPYVVGGLRTEQIAVYGLLATVGFVYLACLQIPRLAARAWLLFSCWALYAVTGVLAGLGGPPATRWLANSYVAGLDNLAGPLAIMLLVWATVTPATAQRSLRLAARLIAVGLAVNGVLAVVSTRTDLTGVLRPFWATAGIGETTAQNAIGNGRFCGVFNQPAEAGLAYGVAAVCAWYVFRDRRKLLYPVLAAIVLGGVLSVSKVFLLGGLPVLLWLLLSDRRTRLSSVFAVAAAAFGLAQSGLADQWPGVRQLQTLLVPGSDGLLGQVTGGRLGGSGTLSAVFDEVWRVSPWFGLGPQGLQVPYDNAWIEAFVVAGVIGVVAYTAALLVLLVIARRDADVLRRRLTTWLVVIVTGASFGLPALTANRASTMVWLLIALVVVAQAQPAQVRPSATASRRRPVSPSATGRG